MSPAQQQALEAILTRSSIDLEFRQRLLTEPRAAIQEAFGVKIPAEVNVRFIEKEEGVDALVVLPDLQRPAGELADDDLDVVAGGAGGGPPDANPTW